jgi:hypothetical protein
VQPDYKRPNEVSEDELRRVGQILGVYLLVHSVACASGITGCLFDSVSMNLNQCYSANTFFTTPLNTAPVTVDWGTAFGRAITDLGNNPHDVSKNPWTTNIAGVNVGVTVDSDFRSDDGTAGRFLTRVDNEVKVWDPQLNAWVVPESSSDPSIFTSYTYGGHFNAPGPAPLPGEGAHLLEMFNGNTNGFGTGSYVINFDQGISSAGLLVSIRGSGTNTDFDATINAFDKNGVFLATYVINTAGVGGQCTGLNNTPPTPCNDAPFIGIHAPTNTQIYRIVISATTGVGNLDSVLLDSLQFEVAAPEPAVVFLCGAGLVLIGVLRRKHAGAGGSKP